MEIRWPFSWFWLQKIWDGVANNEMAGWWPAASAASTTWSSTSASPALPPLHNGLGIIKKDGGAESHSAKAAVLLAVSKMTRPPPYNTISRPRVVHKV